MPTFRASLPARRVAAPLAAAFALTAVPLAAPAGPLPLAPAPAAAQAENPTPPKAGTGAAEGLSRTGATLTASVNPGGAETTVRFEYGTTSSFGLTTAAITVPAGSADVPVRQALSGLTVDTTYHYRVVATNAAGVVRGARRTFTTQANPKAPSVSTRAASGIGGNGATLNGRINPQGQETTFWFEYGTSTRYGKRTPAQPAGAGTATISVSAAAEGLEANKKHYFRLVAENATGRRYTTSRSFTTTRGLTGITATAGRKSAVWNTGATISGTVGGAKPGGVRVALVRSDHPYTGGFRQVATQTTSSTGAFSFDTGPLYESVRFQVVSIGAGAVASPAVTVRSRLWSKLRISKRRAATYTLAGRVYPAVPNARTSVQRRTPKGRWIRVKRTTLRHDTVKNRSTYRVSVPRLKARSARYRVVVMPRDGGAHITTNAKSVVVKQRR